MRSASFGLAIVLALGSNALAQVGPADLVGNWQADTGASTGPCTVELRNGNGMVGLSAASRSCLGQLGFLNGWQPNAKGVSLLGLSGEVIGSLTVGGGKLQGRLADGTIISLTPLSGQNLSVKRSASCIHNPDHGYCADPGEVAVPSAFPVKVKALHPLAIRQLPSSQSASLGQIADGQCFVVDQCVATNEGAKCHIPAASGLQEGWASKHFMQDGTMFVGFQNFC
jgi:hypothetical protein